MYYYQRIPLVTLSNFFNIFSLPQIQAQCSDRNFAYQMTEELHHPWMKKLFVGFAQTSEFNGPRMPIHSHPLIEEISGSNIIEPVFHLPYRIFGSSPPVQSFDPAKMLTVLDFHLLKNWNN